MELAGFALAMLVLIFFTQSGGYALHLHTDPHGKNPENPADLRWIFRENGIEPDIITYNFILRVIRSGKIEEAERLIHECFDLPFEVASNIAWGLDREFILNTTDHWKSFLLFTLGIVLPGMVIVLSLAWALFTLH